MRRLFKFNLCILTFFAATAGAAEVRKQSVQMPGDEEFGFFQKPGFCRVRTKVRCSFQVASTPARETIVDLKIKSNFVRSRTNDDGVLDVKFRCDSELLNQTVKFVTASYSSSFTLKDVPSEIMIPEHKCNVDVRW